MTERLAEPVLKWAGGKRQLLPEILPRMPARIRTYYEPFAGGLAVLFALANERRFERAVVGDMNLGIANLYTELRDDLGAVLSHLRNHASKHSEHHFYEQREMPLDRGPAGAARFIYLNRTCFNGLYRVNKSGHFNTPMGDYKSPTILDADGLRAAARALKGVDIVHGDFETLSSHAGVGDFVYFDPPYLPLTPTANFVAFHEDGFGIKDHERLATTFAGCVRRGARVLLSNSDTPETRRIFGRPQWKLEAIDARRNINSDAGARGPVSELLVSAPRGITRKLAPSNKHQGV
jgi:DNA adenine methylase